MSIRQLSTDLYLETVGYVRPRNPFSRGRDAFSGVPDDQIWIFEGPPDPAVVVGGESHNPNLPRIPIVYPTPLHKFWKYAEIPCEVCLFEEVGLSMNIHLSVLVMLVQPLKYLDAIRKQNDHFQETQDLLNAPLKKALRNMLSWTVQRPGELISPLTSQDLKPGYLTKLLGNTEITRYVVSQPDFAACGVEVRVRFEHLSMSSEYKMALELATDALDSKIQENTIKWLMSVVSPPGDRGELSFREECYNALAPYLEEESFDAINDVLEDAIRQTIPGSVIRFPALKFLMQALFKDILRDQLIHYLQTRLVPGAPVQSQNAFSDAPVVSFAPYEHLGKSDEWDQPPTALPSAHQVPLADSAWQKRKMIQPPVSQDVPYGSVAVPAPMSVTMSSPVPASSGTQRAPYRKVSKNKPQQGATIPTRRPRRSEPANMKSKLQQQAIVPVPQDEQGSQTPQIGQPSPNLRPDSHNLSTQSVEQSSPLGSPTSPPSEGTVSNAPSDSPLVQPKKDLTSSEPLSSEAEDAIAASVRSEEDALLPSTPSLPPVPSVSGSLLALVPQQESTSPSVLSSTVHSTEDPEPMQQSPVEAQGMQEKEHREERVSPRSLLEQHVPPKESSPAQNLPKLAQAPEPSSIRLQKADEVVAPPKLSQAQPLPVDHPKASPASPPPKLTRGQLKLAQYPTQKLFPLEGLNTLPLDRLAGRLSNAPNSSPPGSNVPRPVASRLAIDEKKYREASKVTREEQIDHLYACEEIVQTGKWVITPEKDKVSEDIYINIGNNYKVWLKRIFDTYPVIQVVWWIEKLPQLDVNGIVIPLLNDGADLYQLVKAIADALPKIDRLRKNNDNIIV